MLGIFTHRGERGKLLRDPERAWSRWTRRGRKRHGSHEILHEPSGFHSRYQRVALKSSVWDSKDTREWAEVATLHTTHSVMSLSNVTSSEAQEPLTLGASLLSNITEGPKAARP